MRRLFSFVVGWAKFAMIVMAFGWADPICAAIQEPDRAAPRFEEGQAQIVPAFEDPEQWIRHDLWVETEFNTDGDERLDRMHVSVVRPKQTDTEGLKVPVVYETSPYFAGTGSNAREFFWNPEHELGTLPAVHEHPPAIPHRARRPVISSSQLGTWVPRGFAVVHSSSPGTGLSQGCPTVGGDNESLAPKAVIDWLNGRAAGYTTPDGDERVEAFWCTGKVGMTGTSYNGTLPLAAATTGVDGLACIIPIAPNTSYYHYYRSNGLVRHPGGYMGEDIDVLYDFINSGDPQKREYCDCEVRDKELVGSFERENGDYNDFWAGRDYLNDLGPMKAATLMSHGFNDWNVMPEHSIRIYRALRAKGVPAQLYMHQDGHGGEPPLEMMNRWFTRYLYGIENGVENDPKAWIVRETDRRNKPTPYPDYPHPEAKPVVYYPHAGGRGVGELRSEPAAAETQEMLVDDVSISGPDLARAENSEHRLLYALPPQNEPIHLSGTSRVRIRLASNRPAANLSIWLVALPVTDPQRPTDNLITRGWADPQNYKSLTESEPLVSGRFYDLEFDLQPDDQVIPVGKQVALMIFSSDRDFTLWPPSGTELTIDLSATSLTLPIVPVSDSSAAPDAPAPVR